MRRHPHVGRSAGPDIDPVRRQDLRDLKPRCVHSSFHEVTGRGHELTETSPEVTTSTGLLAELWDPGEEQPEGDAGRRDARREPSRSGRSRRG